MKWICEWDKLENYGFTYNLKNEGKLRIYFKIINKSNKISRIIRIRNTSNTTNLLKSIIC